MHLYTLTSASLLEDNDKSPQLKSLEHLGIAGDWNCEGSTAYYENSQSTPWRATLRIDIDPKLFLVRMVLDDGNIGFYSQNATIELLETGEVWVRYLYANLPSVKPDANEAYFGHSAVLFSKGLTTAEGQYFNDEKRKTFGQFRLTRKSR